MQFRAPEEYTKHKPETAAIDVWALGSLFYEILTGDAVWEDSDDSDLNEKIIQKKIVAGELPLLEPRARKGSDPSQVDPVDESLIRAIKMCFIYEPKDRPKAGVVADFLKNESRRMGVDWEGKAV
jgi:serine/threonine protein kinase